MRFSRFLGMVCFLQEKFYGHIFYVKISTYSFYNLYFTEMIYFKTPKIQLKLWEVFVNSVVTRIHF